MESYPDTNGNGVPDAFENRRSITDILNPEAAAAESRLESKSFVEFTDGDKPYRVFALSRHKALLLEIKHSGRPDPVAYVFRSHREVTQFIDDLVFAANEAFLTD